MINVDSENKVPSPITQGSIVTRRNEALDALRGLAALTVVLTHFFSLKPLLSLSSFPMSLLLNGHEAVILFFVLSGFVLSLQVGSASYSYVPYLIKRVCRIYLPYLMVIALTMVLSQNVPAISLYRFGEVWGEYWPKHITAAQVVAHLQFLTPFETAPFDQPIWTLIYEMRISFIFPLIYFGIRRFGIASGLGVSAFISVAACYVMMHTHHDVLLTSFQGGWLPTLHYLFMFSSGACLALSHEGVDRLIRTPVSRAVVFCSGIGLFLFSHKLALLGKFSLNWMLYDWITTIGVCLMIACLMRKNRSTQFLRSKPLVALGQVSYSLYLTHIVVILVVFRTLSDFLPFAGCILVAIIGIILTSYVTYHGVERPAMRLGTLLAKKFRG